MKPVSVSYRYIGIIPISVSVQYGGYRYWYRFGIEGMDMGPSENRFHNICIIYLYQNWYDLGIGIVPIYRYRIDMGDFEDIGICLNILLTDTDI